MRTITFLTALALTVSTAALAQSGDGTPGDAPQNKGSTGWTGAQPEIGGASRNQNKPNGEQSKPTSQTTGQAVQVHDDAEAKDQPTMATGADLKGPGEKFPPSKTPE